MVKKGGMTRRQMMTWGTLGLAGWLLNPVRTASAALQEDLEMVTHIPQMVGRAAPLLVFHDFIDDPDPESAAYHRYCRDITDYVFEMNRMDNFYETITCPQVSYPPLPKTGIAAFLVHRLAKQYEAVCRFTAESGRSVKFKANGAIFSNHLGAVDLEIEMLEPGRYGLKRKPFTIWQNDTKNLYTLMSVPVEETLHYYLGTATDREIAAEMEENPPENLSTARRLAEEWMAVEESVVGGLVKGVLKRIRLVGDLGFEDALGLYMDSPSDFRDRLFHKKMHNSGITVSQRTDSVPYRKLVSPP
ncbi:MAG: hypothetical protein HGJ93_09765 [Desulfosarcina sp.]|nr:hypothetical protein [Desulfosarcina sp.]MBC2766223.1 hypothetical protein [Desulfosarcina sp.]